MASKSTKTLSSNKNKRLVTMLVFALVFSSLGYLVRVMTHAAPPSGPSSIKLNETDTYLGSIVTFTSTYPKLKGNITPRIDVWCFQDRNSDGIITTTRTIENGDYVYAEAISSDQNAEYELTGRRGAQLGGNPDRGSIWRQNGGGPATCNAELFYFSMSGKQQIRTSLAETPNWQAGDAR